MIVLIASIVDIFVHIKQTKLHIVATKNFQLLKLRQKLHISVINSLDSERNLSVGSTL